MQSCFIDGKSIREINHTFLTLVPKKNPPSSMNNYRQIACCNFMYKVLAKTLCDRLKFMLEFLISPNQQAFIPNRNIAEGVMLVHEQIRGFNSNGADRMCNKVDLNKAYDTINKKKSYAYV